MLPTFQLQLRQPILERVAEIGRFDGKHPSLACGTTAGKVFLHSPNDKNEGDADGAGAAVMSPGSHQPRDPHVRFLKLNRKVSALTAGRFTGTDAGDALLVGTQSSLLAYDVEKNSDIFYKDVPDGVHTMLFAPMPLLKGTSSGGSGGGGNDASSSTLAPSQMIVVGGNCSLQGFARDGSEVLWTVTGDHVRALALSDITSHGRRELVTGSDDFELRAFHHDELVFEATETAAIVALTAITKHTFGYALANGTVGVYRGRQRAWRVKSKNIPTALHAYDVDGDGEKEIVIGWSNGKFEARRLSNGDVLHKEMLAAPIAAIVSADYRMDGQEEVICCTRDGEIRGYVTATGMELANAGVASDDNRALAEEKEVASLSKKKAAIQLELKSLEAQTGTGSGASRAQGGLRIRAGTKIRITNVSTRNSNALELEVATDAEYAIRMVILYEHEVGLFEGESLVVRPTQPTAAVTVALPLTKHQAAKLELKVLVGMRGSNQSCFHVFESTYMLPKFAAFHQLTAEPSPAPQGSVRFHTPVKTQIMCSWLESTFSITTPTQADSNTGNLDVFFRGYRDGAPLIVSFSANETVIRTDDMALAAELVQDMCTHLEWRELDSLAEFPRQMDELKGLLLRVDECNAIRLKLTGEMADDSNQVKALVIRVEDARLLNDMHHMRRYYAELFSLNNQLLGEYTKRSTNHQSLLDALKDVNAMIQLAARLRFGMAKANVVAACRKAIKNNNIHALFYIFRTGKEEHQK